MNKRNHHYVPRFYLQHFASAPRRINIYNVHRLEAFQDGSLKEQCYKPKFYGATDTIENALEQFENEVAPIINSIVTHSEFDSKNPGLLLIFIALQMIRTASHVEMVVQMSQSLSQVLIQLDSQDAEIASKFPLNNEDAMRLSLLMLEDIVDSITDLSFALLKNNSGVPFITSDNPVVKYNQYCESVKLGNVGVLSKGLQIFLPISPNHMFLLYDSNIYRVRTNLRGFIETRKVKDILALNLLQAINANENLLFCDWNERKRIEQIFKSALPYRTYASPHQVFTQAVTNDIIAQTTVTPNIQMNLSFMGIKRGMKNIPINKRINQYRRLSPKSDV